MPALQIPNHMHCAVCNQAIPYVDPKRSTTADRTCSPEHEKALDELNKKRKRQVYLLYGLMALAFVVLIVTTLNPAGA